MRTCPYVWLEFSQADTQPLRLDPTELQELVARCQSVGCSAEFLLRRKRLGRRQATEIAAALAESMLRGQPRERPHYANFFGAAGQRWGMSDERIGNIIGKLQERRRGAMKVYLAYDEGGRPTGRGGV